MQQGQQHDAVDQRRGGLADLQGIFVLHVGVLHALGEDDRLDAPAEGAHHRADDAEPEVGDVQLRRVAQTVDAQQRRQQEDPAVPLHFFLEEEIGEDRADRGKDRAGDRADGRAHVVDGEHVAVMPIGPPMTAASMTNLPLLVLKAAL